MSDKFDGDKLRILYPPVALAPMLPNAVQDLDFLFNRYDCSTDQIRV